MSKFTIYFLSFVLFFASGNIRAYADNDDDACYECHKDPSISMEKKGKTISLEVKKFVLPRSVHAKLKCVNCHIGFDPFEIPHKAKIEPISCKGCHAAPLDKHIFHPSMVKATGVGGSPDVNCKGCHGTHDVRSPRDSKNLMHFSNSTQFCGRCHQSEMADHLKSVHFTEVEMNNPDAPNCIYCHKQPITAGFKLDDVELKINQERLCLKCHMNDPKNPSKYAKSVVGYEQSVHGLAILGGNKKAAICIDCHGVHKLQSQSNPESKINWSNIPNVCGKCHTEISKEYIKSVHGAAASRGIHESPNCTYCHGEHNIHAIPEVEAKAISKTGMNFKVIVDNKMVFCVSCHGDSRLMKRFNLTTVEQSHDWLPVPEKHWRTVRCVDCHSSYEPPNLSHFIMPKEKTVEKCEHCHSSNSVLMTKLYIHEKQRSRDKYGFVNGTLLSDAYVIGTTRNVYLDSFSVIVFALTFLGIGVHGFLRWRFNKARKS
jgi:hypothetical protein